MHANLAPLFSTHLIVLSGILFRILLLLQLMKLRENVECSCARVSLNYFLQILYYLRHIRLFIIPNGVICFEFQSKNMAILDSLLDELASLVVVSLN